MSGFENVLQIIKVIFLRKVLKSWDEFEDERFDRMENREQNTLVPHVSLSLDLFALHCSPIFPLLLVSPTFLSHTIHVLYYTIYIYYVTPERSR